MLKRSRIVRKAKILPPRGHRMPQVKRKVGTGRVVAKKQKSISKLIKQADAIFSVLVRRRDGHCQFPGCTSTKKLQCSHYIGRAHKATRWDYDNCIALCWYHHYKSKDLGYEYQKQTVEKHGWDGQYTLFMKRWLGPEKWATLQERAKRSQKVSRQYLESLIASL